MRISSGLQEGSKKLVYGGEAVEDVRKGIVAPAGEVVADISDSITKMINDKLFMAVLVVGGVYLAGQFLQGAGKSLTKSSKKMSED